MDAIEKSISRNRAKRALRERQAARKPKVTWGSGLGWPEPHDFPSREAYIAARKAADPDYTSGHDGKLWAIV